MTRRRRLALVLACLLVVMTGCANHNTAQESGAEIESDTKANTNANTNAEKKTGKDKENNGESSEKIEENAPTANTSGSNSGSPVTIKIANYAVLEKGYEEFWQNVKEGYEAKYPNITVEWVTAPYGEILNQVINMAGGGDKVDCVFGEDIWIPSLVEAGLAAPMDQVLDSDFLNDYYPNALAAHSMDDTVYAAPLYLTPPVLFYNKELFKEAGLDPEKPPKSYDEMMVMAEKLSQLKSSDGNKVYAFGFPTGSVIVVGSYLQGLIKNFGGEIFDADGKLNVKNTGFVDAFKFLQELDEKGYNPQNAKAKDLRNLFALGQLAMYYDKTGGINGVTSINPAAADFTATACPLAGGGGSGETVSQSHCFIAIDNGQEKKEAVKNFIQYVITPEVMEDYMTNIAPAYPAKKAMEHMEGVNNSAFLAGARDTVNHLSPSLMFPTVADFNLELCALAQAVTMGDEEVQTAAADFEKSVQPLLP